MIIIEGIIGAGKTTLAKRLSEVLQLPFIGERFEQNELLPKFYADRDRYALELELSFLHDRKLHIENALNKYPDGNFVMDFHPLKCLCFAQMNLTADQFFDFKLKWEEQFAFLPKPEVVFVLNPENASTLGNINKRGRNYERSIEQSYLDELHKMYNQIFVQENILPLVRLNYNLDDDHIYDRLFEKITSYTLSGPSVHFLEESI